MVLMQQDQVVSRPLLLLLLSLRLPPSSHPVLGKPEIERERERKGRKESFFCRGNWGEKEKTHKHSRDFASIWMTGKIF